MEKKIRWKMTYNLLTWQSHLTRLGLDSAVAMTSRNLIYRWQWHRGVWLCDVNDIFLKNMYYLLSFTLNLCTYLANPGNRIKGAGLLQIVLRICLSNWTFLFYWRMSCLEQSQSSFIVSNRPFKCRAFLELHSPGFFTGQTRGSNESEGRGCPGANPIKFFTL